MCEWGFFHLAVDKVTICVLMFPVHIHAPTHTLTGSRFMTICHAISQKLCVCFFLEGGGWRGGYNVFRNPNVYGKLINLGKTCSTQAETAEFLMIDVCVELGMCITGGCQFLNFETILSPKT